MFHWFQFHDKEMKEPKQSLCFYGSSGLFFCWLHGRGKVWREKSLREDLAGWAGTGTPCPAEWAAWVRLSRDGDRRRVPAIQGPILCESGSSEATGSYRSLAREIEMMWDTCRVSVLLKNILMKEWRGFQDRHKHGPCGLFKANKADPGVD